MQLNHLILFNLLFTGIYSQVDPNFCNVDNLGRFSKNKNKFDFKLINIKVNFFQQPLQSLT